jgi:hypothetical protein
MSIFVVMRRAWQRITQAKEKNYLRWNTFTFAGILFIIICGINATKVRSRTIYGCFVLG